MIATPVTLDLAQGLAPRSTGAPTSTLVSGAVLAMPVSYVHCAHQRKPSVLPANWEAMVFFEWVVREAVSPVSAEILWVS